jgi:Prolyl oligopeptidase family
VEAHNLFFIGRPGERRRQTEWRAKELLGATEAILALNEKRETPSFLKDTPNLSFQGRIQKHRVFFMGHSFGGATALTAAYRRPDLVKRGGGVIAHEPVADWLPDDARMSLFPPDRIQGLDSSQNFTGGMGGLDYNQNTTTEGESATPESSIHDVNLLFLFSEQWRESVRELTRLIFTY